MSILIDKAGFTAQMHESLLAQAALAGQDIDGMRLIQLMSGILVETLLLFDDPDEGLAKTFSLLEQQLSCTAHNGTLGHDALPPGWIIDYETEQGRCLARKLFEDWLDCAYEFHDLIVFIVQSLLLRLEQDGQPRSETLRIFMECATRCMAYEIAAQELCDIVIETKIGREGWTLGESVAGLSAVSGRCLALSQNACQLFSAPSLPDKLDQVSYVMTQEAVRLGIPAGTDWRFGLAANDCPVTAPFDLIFNLWPCCKEFLTLINLNDPVDQAVACAKAAGRMLAVAAGGENPDMEPVIAKPLAMAAMTDTYKTVCREEALAL
ncbi:MAG TPA: hypothetical protein VIF12_06280 [Micavibrio sp.]